MQGADGTKNMPHLQMVVSGGRAPHLSIIQVIIALCKNQQVATTFIETFCYECMAPNPRLCGGAFKRTCRIIGTVLGPTMPLRLQEVYGYTSLQIGLIFMAGECPMKQ